MPTFTLDSWNWWGAKGDLSRPVGDRLPTGSAPDAGGKAVPAIQRRRLGFAGRGLTDAISGLPEPDSDGLKDVFSGCDEVIFASRYADTTRSQRLLEQITGDEAVSPADFSMAVHNALPGLLTLVAKSPVPYTSLTGGEDTLVMGLIDSLGRLHRHRNGKVLFIYVDQPLPDIWAEFDGTEAVPVALAMMMSSNPADDGHRFSLQRRQDPAATTTTSGSAQTGIYDLIALLSAQQTMPCALSSTWTLEQR